MIHKGWAFISEANGYFKYCTLLCLHTQSKAVKWGNYPCNSSAPFSPHIHILALITWTFQMKSIFFSPWKIASFLYFVYINSDYFLVHVHRWQKLLQINHLKSNTFLFPTGEPYSNSDTVQQARDSLLSPSLQPWEARSKWRPCHPGFDRSCNSQAACNSPVTCALSDVQTSLGAREEVKSSSPAVRGWIAPSPLPAGVGITDEHVPPKFLDALWSLSQGLNEAGGSPGMGFKIVDCSSVWAHTYEMIIWEPEDPGSPPILMGSH